MPPYTRGDPCSTRAQGESGAERGPPAIRCCVQMGAAGIGSPWLNCSLGVETFLTASRLPALLNAAAPQLDYWGTWGDNFYDKNGSLSTRFFSQLTTELKSRVFFSAAGNHDFWMSGSPNHSTPDDQFGNGYMQYYAMDSAAAQPDPSRPFNFSVSPDGAQPGTPGFLPDARNFVHYSKVGDLGLSIFPASSFQG